MEIKLDNILKHTIKQLFFINEILIPYNLIDLKRQIMYLVNDINDVSDTLLFAKGYLTNILLTMNAPILTLNQKENAFHYGKLKTIELFNEFATFTNYDEFINYFDMFNYAHATYLKVINDISTKFGYQYPSINITFEFSDVLKKIKLNNGKYTMDYTKIKFTDLELNRLAFEHSSVKISKSTKELCICICICETIPKEFMDTFTKIRNKFYNENNFLSCIVHNLSEYQKYSNNLKYSSIVTLY